MRRSDFQLDHQYTSEIVAERNVVEQFKQNSNAYIKWRIKSKEEEEQEEQDK